MEPSLEYALEVRLRLKRPRLELKPLPVGGARLSVQIESGEFEGKDMRGTVLPGGGEWPHVRTDGVFCFDARYQLLTGDGVDYTSTFPIGPNMRVNVFVFGEMADPRIRAFQQDALGALAALQPGLSPWLAGCQVHGAVDLFAVELSISEGSCQPGLAVIGDAYRTACSAVGNGLTCLLVDVVRLAAHVPRWLAAPGMGLDKVSQFYDDPIKKEMDSSAHQMALQRRNSVLDQHRVNRVRRDVHFVRRRLAFRLAAWHGKAAQVQPPAH